MQENQKLTIDMPEGIDDDVRILQLLRGTINGDAFWAYVAMYPTTYLDYAAKVEAGEEVEIEEYGEILAQGWGQDPPQDVVEKMAREYGADPHFDQDLKEWVEAQQDADLPQDRG